MVFRSSDGEMEFRFFRPDARRVFLVGDFNRWDHEAQPMTRAENGEWSYRLRLPDGIYRFKYHADGEWYADYAAFGLEPHPSGFNSVMVINDKESPAMLVG